MIEQMEQNFRRMLFVQSVVEADNDTMKTLKERISQKAVTRVWSAYDILYTVYCKCCRGELTTIEQIIDFVEEL